MAAGTYNFVIEQGATFKRRLTWSYTNPATGLEEPNDITGYTVKMQIRDLPSDPQIRLELSTENNKIVVDGVNGQMNLTLSALETSKITKWREGYYDIIVTSPLGEVTRLLQGKVAVSYGITKK